MGACTHKILFVMLLYLAENAWAKNSMDVNQGAKYSHNPCRHPGVAVNNIVNYLIITRHENLGKTDILY